MTLGTLGKINDSFSEFMNILSGTRNHDDKFGCMDFEYVSVVIPLCVVAHLQVKGCSEHFLDKSARIQNVAHLPMAWASAVWKLLKASL